MTEHFSVYQFFADDSYERIAELVEPAKAVEIARAYTTNVAAKVGITKRVIITDSGDCIAFEWKFGEGVTYPPPIIFMEMRND